MDQRAEPPSWLPDGTQSKTGAAADVRSPEADEAGEAAQAGPTEYSFDGDSSYSSGYGYEDKTSGETTSQVPPYPAELSGTATGNASMGNTATGNDVAGNDYRTETDESANRTSTFSAVSPRRYLGGGAASLPGVIKAGKANKAAKTGKADSQVSARRADLVVARLEPWSVMKFSFLMSLVAWVVLFVAVALLYFILSSLGVFTSIEHTLASVTSSSSSSGMNLSRWFSASRILGYTMLLGAVNIILITALCTVGSMIYNLVTHLGGGIEVTLRETD